MHSTQCRTADGQSRGVKVAPLARQVTGDPLSFEHVQLKKSNLTQVAQLDIVQVEQIDIVQVVQLDIVQVVQGVYWLNKCLAHYRLCPCGLSRSWHVPDK